MRMVAASSAVDSPADNDTVPVPATRSLNMSDVKVRLSPLAKVRIERRARGFGRLVGISLPILLAFVGVFGALEFRRVAHGESRALAALPEAPRRAPNLADRP